MSQKQTDNARPVHSRMRTVGLWVAGLVFLLTVYLTSVGPVMAVRMIIWGRRTPSWIAAFINAIYFPHAWASGNIPGAHGVIDRYIQWWVQLIDG